MNDASFSRPAVAAGTPLATHRAGLSAISVARDDIQAAPAVSERRPGGERSIQLDPVATTSGAPSSEDFGAEYVLLPGARSVHRTSFLLAW